MPERSQSATLAALRGRVRALEMPSIGAEGNVDVVSSGAPEVDAGLPWGGLPRACVHEVVGEAPGAAEGFSAALAARLIMGRGPALWCLAPALQKIQTKRRKRGRRPLPAGSYYRRTTMQSTSRALSLAHSALASAWFANGPRRRRK